MSSAVLSAEYVLFGSYRTEPKSVELTADGIRFNTRFRYRDHNSRFKCFIAVGFDQIRHVFHCTDVSLPLLAIRLTEESVQRIRASIALSEGSTDDAADGLSLSVDAFSQ